ncbi:MAG: complex I 51 kDa subunit family protein [Halanaerobiales bacterium]
MEETTFLKDELHSEINEYDFPVLKKTPNMSKEKVISEIKNSGLKGRGGAGFPTGVKWDLANSESDECKYVICNGDEGEPGTYKDRFLMEEAPLRLLEGIEVAAYAVGAEKGYIYIRGEYTEPIKIFKNIIEKAYKKGILGSNILNSGFDFDLEMVRGAGAYVCGDETSLLNSIEGKRGRSRIKPPYPVSKGLFGKPTVVNNVETLTAAANIIDKGSEVYKALGTENSRGTKLVCLSGNINNPGIFEVEFGSCTLEDIIYKFGDGPVNNTLKMVVPGGISTSILTPEELGVSYTYEDMEEAGSSLGSGAIIIVGEDEKLIDLLINVSRFFMDETCGTCFPCREGNRQVNYILKEVKENKGKMSEEKINLINDIGNSINLAARCGLGQTSLNFIGSVLDKFKNEFIVRGGENG